MKKQLGILFLAQWMIMFVGIGLMTLTPVYASALGASPTGVGLLMAASYGGMAVGAVGAGALAKRVGSYKRVLMLVGGVGAALLTWMGQTTGVVSLAVLSVGMSFCLAVGLALVNILTGLTASSAERGRVYGMVSLANPLGALFGSLVMGSLADRLGFAIMFTAVGLGLVALPIVVGAGLADQRHLTPGRGSPVSETRRVGVGRPFWLFCLLMVLATSGAFVGRLGSVVEMRQLGFGPAQIASALAVGGLVSLPLIPLFGALSDRLGRRVFLALAFVLSALGLTVLNLGSTIWYFWLSAAFISVAMYAQGAVGAALAMDLLPGEAIAQGMSLFSSMFWLAGVIGFGVTGGLIDWLGAGPVFFAGALAPLVAGLLLAGLRPQASPASARPLTWARLWRPLR